MYRDIFYYLESISLLDPNNEIDVYCLHYVYIPRINHCLYTWKLPWIKHPMTSENNLSPEQHWTYGLQSINGTDTTIAREVFHGISKSIVHLKLILAVNLAKHNVHTGPISYCVSFK